MNCQKIASRVLAALLLGAALTGCSSVLKESASVGAGLASAGIAAAVTNDKTVTAGIGLGVNAAAQAGLKAAQKRVHQAQQDVIAAAAGPLAVGAVAPWASPNRALEGAAHGQVTVSRAIQSGGLDCKEVVFSVEAGSQAKPTRAVYTTTVCRDGAVWKWASAEPATQRWGALQ